MLKRWFERNEEPDERVIAAVCIADHLEEDNEGIGNQLMEPRDTYRDVKIAETLSIEQRRELEEYLKEYSAVLTNVPGRTSVLKHSVITTSDIPVRQKPYQIPHALRYEVKKELMAMVEAGTVEPSKAGLTVNQKKCEFGAYQMEFLGHLVGNSQVNQQQRKFKLS
nr:uncharacterized protein LOC117689193 [Crassostrea gigas]